jgi:hypothetical protein
VRQPTPRPPASCGRRLISNDAKGNLVDQDGNKYSAQVDGNGLHFTREGGEVPIAGAVVDGSKRTSFTQTSGALAGFSFRFFPPGKGQTAAGLFRFQGSLYGAVQALRNAGFGLSLLDELFNVYEMVHNPDSFNLRSSGDSRTGANSGHVLLDFPKFTLTLRKAVPIQGKVHFGETNPNRDLLQHLCEVFHRVAHLFRPR